LNRNFPHKEIADAQAGIVAVAAPQPAIFSFTVPGVPGTAGSKKYVGHRAGRPVLVDDAKKGKEWRASVQLFARQAGVRLLAGPVQLCVTFYMPRPAGHYKAGDRSKPVKDSAPARPLTKPDCTKMLRAVEDALKGIAWHDDSQVVSQRTEKHYAGAEGPRCFVAISEHTDAF
jgi:Holliday junction resolvase RusA-like endonuclease